MNVFKAVRRRLSLSTSSAGGHNAISIEASLVSKSLDDLRLAPYEENDGKDMVFYCKILGSEHMRDKNGSELGPFADRVIRSYSAVPPPPEQQTPKEGEGESGSGTSAGGQQPQLAAQPPVVRRILDKNKTMIRVNCDGLEWSTDGSTEKSKFKLNHVSYVSAAFTYTHCAAIICQSVSSPTKWRAYLLLFSKPKYAKRFAVFMAKQFDVGYEKWQSEQAEGTLDLAVEQEALKLKSRLKQGLTNKVFVQDEEIVISPKTSANSQLSQDTKSFLDTENAGGQKTEHSSEHNYTISQNSGQVSHVTSSSSINEAFAEINNETPENKSSIGEINLTPVDSDSFRRIAPPPLPARPSRNTRHPFMSSSQPSQSVPQHLLDSRDGYNEFFNAERHLSAMMKETNIQKDHTSSPVLDDAFSGVAASWAPNQDPFLSFFEMRNSNVNRSDASFSSSSLFSTQISNGAATGFTPFDYPEEHKLSDIKECPTNSSNQNFLLEL